MPKRRKPMLDGPIPGQSLTSEPGARPWEQPAKYSTIEDTLEFYLDKLSEPKKMAHLLDKIEEGAPLTLIADTLQTLGVSKGLHSLDVGVLVSPVLIEFMKAAAEQEEIEYRIGTEEPEDEGDMDLANSAVKEVYKETATADEEEPMPMETEEMAEAPPVEKTGLMARPSKPVEEMEDGI